MQQHEREKCAHNQRTATTLRNIADEIHTSRCLIQAAEMASNCLTQHQRDPLVELLAMVSERLDAHASALTAQADQEGTPDAA